VKNQRLLPRVAHYGGVFFFVISAFAYLMWLPLGPVSPTMADFSAYYSAGKYWSLGGDPYGVGIWSIEKTLPGFHPSRLELLPFVGPPLSLLLWAAFGVIPYVDAAAIWAIVVIGSAAMLMWIPAHLAQRRLKRTDVLSLLLLALSSGPLVTGISVGQAALPAAAAVGLALLCATQRRWLLMLLAALVAGTLKPNDALAIAAVVREPAALLAIAGSVVAATVASLPITHGIHGIVAYVHLLLSQGGSERLYAYQFASTSVAYGFGMAPRSAEILGSVLSVAALGAIVIAIRMTRANVVDGAAIACALFPFVVPFDHEPDMVIVLLPALLVVFRTHSWTWAIGAAGTVLLCTDPFALMQGWPGLIFAVAMAAVAALQLAALAPPQCKSIRFAPFAIIPFVLAIGLFAPPNHLPLWPATLPAHVSVTPGASASATWHDELVASGLEIRLPWVSLARMLTLFGCLCVGIAMVRTAREGIRSVNQSELPSTDYRATVALLGHATER
jgi:hypothetical protein